MISLPGLKTDMFEPNHISTIRDFLTLRVAHKLIIFIDNTLMPPKLCVQSFLPNIMHEHMMYFIREPINEEIHIDELNFEDYIHYGTIGENAMENLLRTMHQLYVPLFLDNKKWPEGVRKDFNNQLHKFMAFLTDTTNQLQGHTVFYIPEDHQISAAEKFQSKDASQRLESLVIYWTRQIKDVVNAQHSSESSDSLGPLEEISFWRSRCEDLSGISLQLNRPEIARITRVLETSKSPYLEQFLRLSNLIHEGSIQAQDNLKFLSILTVPCQALVLASPVAIPSLLPNILRCVRIIWANSRYYNTKERMTSLLRKVSNEIMRRCIAVISLDDIFHGDIQTSIGCLQTSIDCGEAWKAVFKRTVKHISIYTASVWDFDETSKFNA